MAAVTLVAEVADVWVAEAEGSTGEAHTAAVDSVAAPTAADIAAPALGTTAARVPTPDEDPQADSGVKAWVRAVQSLADLGLGKVIALAMHPRVGISSLPAGMAWPGPERKLHPDALQGHLWRDQAACPLIRQSQTVIGTPSLAREQ